MLAVLSVVTLRASVQTHLLFTIKLFSAFNLLPQVAKIKDTWTAVA